MAAAALLLLAAHAHGAVQSGSAAAGITTPSKSAPSLSAELQKTLFYNSGVVRSTDTFVYRSHTVSYMEPDNVTCINCRWAAGSPWYCITAVLLYYM